MTKKETDRQLDRERTEADTVRDIRNGTERERGRERERDTTRETERNRKIDRDPHYYFGIIIIDPIVDTNSTRHDRPVRPAFAQTGVDDNRVLDIFYPHTPKKSVLGLLSYPSHEQKHTIYDRYTCSYVCTYMYGMLVSIRTCRHIGRIILSCVTVHVKRLVLAFSVFSCNIFALATIIVMMVGA